MSTEIHPTAIIEEGAQIGENVKVGAYAYVGANVKLGDGTHIHHHATVDGYTEMGAGNEVFSYAYIGAKSQDLKDKGGILGLKIGDNNTFREYSSVHLATHEGEATILGDNNFVLAFAHIAHDCVIGNHMILSSHSALGGHVTVEDHVNIGWNSGVHQNCRIGSYAMVGATSKVTQDVLPYMIADGRPAIVKTVNKIGLERKGFSSEDLEMARILFKKLYREGLNRTQAIEQLNEEMPGDSKHPMLDKVQSFIQESKRGLV